MPHPFAQIAERHRGRLLAVVVVSSMGWAAYSASTGVRDLLAKQKQISAMEEQNAELKTENENRAKRIERLSDSSTVEEEIRKLDKLKENEKTFILPKEGTKDEKHVAPEKR